MFSVVQCQVTVPKSFSVIKHLLFFLGQTSEGPTSPDGIDLVKIVVLGSAGVGKTSLIRQFIFNEFIEQHQPTVAKQTYYPSVIINEHLYEVKLVDVPVLPYFPVTSLYEWADFRFYGLRNATAYVLVFDLSNDETFAYIKNLREQIIESRNMHHVPMFVVGNKHDLGGCRDIYRRDLMSIVRKNWKCGYIECSAKYNWRVVTLFKEVMKNIDFIDYGQKPTTGRAAIHEAIRRQKCVIL